MSAGDEGVSVDWTQLSLDTAGHFIVGSQTQTCESQSVRLDGLITGGSGIGGAVVTGPLLLPGQEQAMAMAMFQARACKRMEGKREV